MLKHIMILKNSIAAIPHSMLNRLEIPPIMLAVDNQTSNSTLNGEEGGGDGILIEGQAIVT